MGGRLPWNRSAACRDPGGFRGSPGGCRWRGVGRHRREIVALDRLAELAVVAAVNDDQGGRRGPPAGLGTQVGGRGKPDASRATRGRMLESALPKPSPSSHHVRPSKIVIASRESRLAMWQAVQCQRTLIEFKSRLGSCHSRHDHQGRPDSRPPARRNRRQGPVHQGTRSGDGEGRPTSPCIR